eukprot:gene10853-biopygen3052
MICGINTVREGKKRDISGVRECRIGINSFNPSSIPPTNSRVRFLHASLIPPCDSAYSEPYISFDQHAGRNMLVGTNFELALPLYLEKLLADKGSEEQSVREAEKKWLEADRIAKVCPSSVGCFLEG